MDRLNFNQLYYFFVVATEGSIKAASQKLHLTQPTISTQIKQLEEDLGHELFDRKHRKLDLNPVGKAVFKQAKTIFEMANHLTESLMSEDAGPIRDQFRVGAIQSLSNSFIYEFSTQLWLDPSIQIEVQQGSLGELIQKLNANELDLILTDQAFTNAKRYHSSRISRDKLVAVGSKPMAHLKKNFPNTLHKLPYLGFSGASRIQQDCEFYFETQGIKPQLIGRVDDVTLMRVVTEDSGCFCVLPKKAVREVLKEKKLVELGEIPNNFVDIWGTYSTTSPSKPLIRRVIKQYFKRKEQ